MIKITNLTKSYDSTVIYKNANYTFKGPSLTCFLGASGSGKTTLLNLLAGFDTNYTGEIQVDNMLLNKLSKDELCDYRFNNIGFIFQHYNLLKGYTALENILMASNLSGNIDNKNTEKAEKLLMDLGIKDKENEKIENLSGGQKQRVAIARALINDPKIILADEPTGALDHESSKAIMDILKKISKTKTVVVITHDEDVAKYADEIINLDDYNINVIKAYDSYDEVVSDFDDDINISKMNNKKPTIPFKLSLKLGIKNFKIHFVKFVVSALIIALGSVAFIGALGSKDILNSSISQFKEKNFFFNKGLIPKSHGDKIVNENLEDIFNKLKGMNTIENIYYQYNLENLKFIYNSKEANFDFKMPTPTYNLSMVYGSMPSNSEDEIVISPSLASKFESDIKNIIGKTLTLQYNNKNGNVSSINLKISGIVNTTFDDFIIGSKVENEIYNNYNIKEKTGISFDIKDFNEIIAVQNSLTKDKITVFTKELEVKSFQKTFANLLKLYTLVSYLILIVGLLISSIILYKISIERYTEVGLLSSLGYSKKIISGILTKETLIFSLISTVISLFMVKILDVIYITQFHVSLGINIKTIGILIAINLLFTLGISFIISRKLLNTEPAEALNK